MLLFRFLGALGIFVCFGLSDLGIVWELLFKGFNLAVCCEPASAPCSAKRQGDDPAPEPGQATRGGGGLTRQPALSLRNALGDLQLGLSVSRCLAGGLSAAVVGLSGAE